MASTEEHTNELLNVLAEVKKALVRLNIAEETQAPTSKNPMPVRTGWKEKLQSFGVLAVFIVTQTVVIVRAYDNHDSRLTAQEVCTARHETEITQLIAHGELLNKIDERTQSLDRRFQLIEFPPKISK